MNTWMDERAQEALTWLLESDQPGVRYLAMHHLLDLPRDDPQLASARTDAHTNGPIAAILDHMQPEGYWVKAGPGYSPKYHSTVWSLLLLAQLGAQVDEDARIAQACAYLMDHALCIVGQFSYNGTPSGTFTCLQGNLCAALTALGWRDQRLTTAYEWMARTVTGEGMAPISDRKAPLRYSQYLCGPLFACAANNRLPCAWGAAKVMQAFADLPPALRGPWFAPAVDAGADFLLDNHPAEAAYPTPTGGLPNRSWWKFGFPVFYVTDLLQIVDALARLGYGQDARLQPAWEIIRQKQDAHGRWPLEYDYRGKTWIDVGPRRQPNPWVTIRALRALKHLTVNQALPQYS